MADDEAVLTGSEPGLELARCSPDICASVSCGPGGAGNRPDRSMGGPDADGVAEPLRRRCIGVVCHLPG